MDGPSPPNAAWVTPWIGTLRAPQLAGARPVGPASGRETQLGSCRLGTTVLPGSSCSGDRRRSPMREAGWAHPSLPVPAPAGTPPPPVAVPKASNGGAEGPASAGPQPEQPKRQDGASSPCPLTAQPGSEPPGPGPAVPQPWVRAHRGQGAPAAGAAPCAPAHASPRSPKVSRRRSRVRCPGCGGSPHGAAPQLPGAEGSRAAAGDAPRARPQEPRARIPPSPRAVPGAAHGHPKVGRPGASPPYLCPPCLWSRASTALEIPTPGETYPSFARNK